MAIVPPRLGADLDANDFRVGKLLDPVLPQQAATKAYTDAAVAALAAAMAADLAGKAPLASPALTGTPTAPTAPPGTDSTQIATTAFVLANAPSSSGFSTTFMLMGA